MLVKMQCPHCGANMEIDDSREKIFCSFCGTEIANLKEKIEITQNINMSGTVMHVMDRSNDPNLYISYATAVPNVVMVVRIVDTGTKNTYLNGQSQTYHLRKGQHSIVLKIGKKNYNRTIIIPEDNTPVRINAAYTGRRAEITIDQPNVTMTNTVTGQQTQLVAAASKKKQSVLAIISFILSFLLHAAFVAVPLAILDLILGKKDKDHGHGLSIAALIIGTIMCSVIIMTYVNDAKCSSPKTYTYHSELTNKTIKPISEWEEIEALEAEENLTAFDTIEASESVETLESAVTPTEQVISPNPIIEIPNPTPEVITTGIRPEFQKTMEENLEFFNEYCEFMKEYSKAPTAAMAIRYFELLKEYQEAMTALEEMNTKDMTKEEIKLYHDTLNTIKKMLTDLQQDL